MLIRVVSTAFVLVAIGATTVSAQQATVVGTVLDESKAVLPGVTVTATAVETGRQFVSVTSERGQYRLAGLPPGRYRLEAELIGFAPTVLPDLELLVGQNAEIVISLRVAAVAENITVTGEAPLVDARRAQVASNVDRRQMEALPISGRNWMELSLQVKGITANTAGVRPGVERLGAFRINLDGQDVTQDRVGSFGQGGISRDAIAEYQVITNLFDVTMGRSVGIQVQAVTRSGTNNLAGSLYGYFRDDAFNAKDAFVKRVLPYSNQQVGGSLGGPIIRDKLQYFASYEYERQPETRVVAPAVLAPQRLELLEETTKHYVLGRVDHTLSRADHVTFRSNYWIQETPTLYEPHPATPQHVVRDSQMISGNWSRILRDNLAQEVRVAYSKYHFGNWLREPETISYSFPGLTLGSRSASPSDGFQSAITSRADWTWSKGSHDFKIGAELLYLRDVGYWRRNQRGTFLFSRLPADAATRFPLGAPASQWDFRGLDSTVIRFDRSYATGDDWTNSIPHPKFSAWIGDTWIVRDRLSLNLGVRYDVGWNDFIAPLVKETDLVIDNGLFVENVGYRKDIRDLSNVAPRVGFAWNVTDRGDFIIRGGTGLFFGTTSGEQLGQANLFNAQRVLVTSFANDGRPGFIEDPTRGVTPDDLFSGRVRVPPQGDINMFVHDYKTPRLLQAMLGFQKQLDDVTGFDADVVYQKGSHEDTRRDPNLFYDPATGLFKDPRTFGRPRPDFGAIGLYDSDGYSDYMGLASSFTRRYRNNFQFTLNYTLMFFKRDAAGSQLSPFDVSLEWARATDFQRHTVNANGIWRLPAGFQLAGTFHYGSGNYSTTTAPVQTLGTGPRRVRADLSIIPRNTFKEDPWQSLNIRVSKDLRLFGDVRATGMAEVFNVYNYARYVRNEIDGHPLFGQATSAGSQPRTGQLAFRISW